MQRGDSLSQEGLVFKPEANINKVSRLVEKQAIQADLWQNMFYVCLTANPIKFILVEDPEQTPFFSKKKSNRSLLISLEC